MTGVHHPGACQGPHRCAGEMMITNNYRLVLEFAGDDLETYERVVVLEEKLEAELDAEIDGHDVGEGVVNVFINTSDPAQCFRNAMDTMKDMKVELNAAGFRKLAEDEYERLWPEDDPTPFELK
jgi:hypothetical protein